MSAAICHSSSVGDDQVADQNGEQIVINHRAVIVAVQFAATLLEHGRPEKHGAGERYQPEQRAQEIIPAVHERVLEPDVKNGRVLGDLFTLMHKLIRKPGNARKGTEENKGNEAFCI